jgi:hypothetical protein
MDVNAAMMIGLTPKFIHSHSHNAEERESARDRQPSCHCDGTKSGKSDDELRQNGVEI